LILYHGSNQAVRGGDLSKCRPFKDFGKGFYLSENLGHASRMARRTTRIYGGLPLVSLFEVNLAKAAELAVLRFPEPNREWARFVLNNRSRTFTDLSDPNSNHDAKYDLVVGPIANDDIALLFRQFESGLIDLDRLARGLEYRELSVQHSFHTAKGLAVLTYMEARGG
jgi:hypothetical protein